MAETKVTKNEILNSLYCKRITATIDASAASGDVSYTGVGFKPSSIHCFMTVDNTLFCSDGISDNNKDSVARYQAAANLWYSMPALAAYTNYTSWACNAIVKSYNDDGFTLTWDKINTPTPATMQLLFVCYK